MNDEDEVFYVKKRGRVIPFGFERDPNDPQMLRSIPLQLKALRQAKAYLVTGQYSYRDVTDWMNRATGRKMSPLYLYKLFNGIIKHKITKVNV